MFDCAVMGGTIIRPDSAQKGNLYIKDGKIALIAAPDCRLGAACHIDATGLEVLPGAIDGHAHLNDPGFTQREDFLHGSAAAALGGVTTLLDMPLQNAPTPKTRDALLYKQKKIAPQAYVDYGLWGGLTGDNFDELTELARLGVIGFKVFLAPVSPDYVSLSLGEVRLAMERLRRQPVRFGFHCEDYSIIKSLERQFRETGRCSRQDFLASRPLSAELIATYGALTLGRELGYPVHICHISHPQVVELVQAARQQGCDATCETCPHYLYFDQEDLLSKGALYKCAPPLREPAARRQLTELLLAGQIDCVATDHSPCMPKEKAEGDDFFKVWGGISGLQYLVQLVYDLIVHQTGGSPQLVAQLLGAGPARAFGLDHRKGALRPGLDADLVLLDPQRSWEIDPQNCRQLHRSSTFFGCRGRGLPVLTMLRGQVLMREQTLLTEPGYGQWIKRRQSEPC